MRLFIQHRITDQYNIARELAITMAVAMVVVPFQLTIAFTAPVSATVRQLNYHCPSHILNTVTFVMVASAASWYWPFILDAKSLPRTPRLQHLQEQHARLSLGLSALRVACRDEAGVAVAAAFRPPPSPTATPAPGPSFDAAAWRALLGAKKGTGLHFSPYRQLPPMVLGACCGPHDAVAWWLRHACCRGPCPACCRCQGPEGVPTRAWWAYDSTVDGLACSVGLHAACPLCRRCNCQRACTPHTCCAPGQGDTAGDRYLAGPSVQQGVMVDDSSGPATTSRGEVPCVLWRPLAMRCCDFHAYAAAGVVWSGLLGTHQHSPALFCPCCRGSTEAAADSVDAREEAVLCAADGTPMCVPSVLRSGDLDGEVHAVRLFLQRLSPAQQQLLSVTQNAMRAVEKLADATSSSGGAEQGSDGEDEEVLVQSAMDTSGTSSVYESAFMRGLAWLLCVTTEDDEAAAPYPAGDADKGGTASPASESSEEEASLATRKLSLWEAARVKRSNPQALAAVWTLPAVIMHPEACLILRHHSRSCLCPELVDFIVAVREYKRRLAIAYGAFSAAARDVSSASDSFVVPGSGQHSDPSTTDPVTVLPSPQLCVWLGLVDKHKLPPTSSPAAAALPQPRTRWPTASGAGAARATFAAGLNLFSPQYLHRAGASSSDGGSGTATTTPAAPQQPQAPPRSPDRAMAAATANPAAPPTPSPQSSRPPRHEVEGGGSWMAGVTLARQLGTGSLSAFGPAGSISDIGSALYGEALRRVSGLELRFAPLTKQGAALPRLSPTSTRQMVQGLLKTFLVQGAPLEVNVSSALRARTLHEASAVCGPEVLDGLQVGAVTPASQRRGRAFSTAPVPSTLAETAAVSHQGSDPQAAVQVQLDTTLRLACLLDEALVEVLKLVDVNVLPSLFESDVGRRLGLLRLRAKHKSRLAGGSGSLHGWLPAVSSSGSDKAGGSVTLARHV